MLGYFAQKSSFKTIKLFFKISFIQLLFLFVFFTFTEADTQRTPSQILPDSFKKPETNKGIDSKEKENLFPETEGLSKIKPESTGIFIIPKTLIIIAPEQLQDKIDFQRYRNKVVGVELKIEDLYVLASEITKEFVEKGFPLVRAIIPKQELKAENATIFVKVIDGFIERIDMSKVPKMLTLKGNFYLQEILLD